MEFQTTAIIGRNFADIDALMEWVNGLIGRGISGQRFTGLAIADIHHVQPFFHKFDDQFDVLAIVVLRPEASEE